MQKKFIILNSFDLQGAGAELGVINITNKGNDIAVIDIEGVIGVPERWQFDNDADKVATHDRLATALNAIKELKAKEIRVNIRSLGGDVNHAFMILDSLNENKAIIKTYAYGYIASAATILHQAGIERNVSDNGLYLIHQSSMFAMGNTNDIAETQQLLAKTDTRIASIYAKRSGREEKEFVKQMGKNNGNGEWLTADEAVQAGLADKAISMPGVSNFASSLITSLGLPPLPEKEKPILTNMKKTIIAAWAVLASLWNVRVGDEVQVSDDMLTSLNNEISTRDVKITGLEKQIADAATLAIADKAAAGAANALAVTAAETLSAENKTAIEAANATIATLTADLAAAKGDKTTLKEVEDPTIANSLNPENRSWANKLRNKQI